MFNFSGSELVFLLLLALIILGPEKLPEAIRKFGQTYAEFKKVTTGFQSELKQALDEPVREMRQTAELFKQAASFDVLKDEQTTAAVQQAAADQPASSDQGTSSDQGAAPPLASAAVAAAAATVATPSDSSASDSSASDSSASDSSAQDPTATDGHTPQPVDESTTRARSLDDVIVRQPFGQAAALPTSPAPAPVAETNDRIETAPATEPPTEPPTEPSTDEASDAAPTHPDGTASA